ncbi:MAG: response regulator [Fulvivirga sp.]|uniref:response regulator n=1 Tax=Fulvivirga sp. TaxID=1931237 RepID=UPI0032EE24AE
MKKILIIEDNNEIRENIGEILELADYQTVLAENGKVGVDLAIKEKPDLIICDIMMPELDGYGVLHILSKKEATASIPFIFLTAKAEKADLRKGMGLGADDYLTKPFDDTELLDSIESRLRKVDALRKDYGNSPEGVNRFIKDVKKHHNLESLTASYEPRLFKKKNEIFRNGDYPNHLYLVVSGKVKTLKSNEDGKELITGIYASGDFFGYEAMLEEIKHEDSAETIEDSSIIQIPKTEFFDLLYTNRDVAQRFIQMLSKNVVDREQQLIDLAYNSVRQRTAGALLKIFEKFGSDSNEPIKVSRDDLSNMVGTATESVIRVLSDLKDEKIIEIQSGKILIKELDKLEQIQKWHVAR